MFRTFIRRLPLIGTANSTVSILCCYGSYDQTITFSESNVTLKHNSEISKLDYYEKANSNVSTLFSKSFEESLCVTRSIMEASGRGLHLLKVAFLMVLDYECAKYSEILFKEVSIGKSKRSQLKEDVNTHNNALRKAQLIYTGNDKSPGTVKLTSEQKRKAVHDAAEALSNCEIILQQYEDNHADLSHSNSMTTIHTGAAKRLLRLCQENGGVYIKIGQHLANLDYLIPQEYITVLSCLFDNNPITSYEQVCAVIEEELGGHPEDIFDNFAKEPLASASLAQVHIGYDKETGRKFAIKVQHAGLRETSRGDLISLEFVVKSIQKIFGEDVFKWGWILEEIAPNLPKELDFCNEGRNAEKSAAHIYKTGISCVVPKVHWPFTTSRVLCMDFEEGFRCNDVQKLEKSGLKKRDVAELVSSLFNSQVFQSGFIHCDPHPANVLLRENNGKPEIVLVDHGLYKQIDDDFKLTYARLWKALMMADIIQIKQSCKELGIDEMYPLLAAMLTSRPFDEILERSKTKSLSTQSIGNNASDKAMIRGYAHQYLTEIIQMLDKVPRQMLLLFKMNDCLRHIDHDLGSPTNTLLVAGKYAAETVYKEENIVSSSLTIPRKTKPLFSGIKSWISYMIVLSRINVHQTISRWFR